MRKQIAICSIMLLSVVGSAQQKEAYSFTLEEAITFAIDSNYTAINARRDIAKALKQKWETTATGLPQISADIAYQNNLKQPVTLLPPKYRRGARNLCSCYVWHQAKCFSYSDFKSVDIRRKLFGWPASCQGIFGLF